MRKEDDLPRVVRLLARGRARSSKAIGLADPLPLTDFARVHLTQSPVVPPLDALGVGVGDDHPECLPSSCSCVRDPAGERWVAETAFGVDDLTGHPPGLFTA